MLIFRYRNGISDGLLLFGPGRPTCCICITGRAAWAPGTASRGRNQRRRAKGRRLSGRRNALGRIRGFRSPRCVRAFCDGHLLGPVHRLRPADRGRHLDDHRLGRDPPFRSGPAVSADRPVVHRPGFVGMGDRRPRRPRPDRGKSHRVRGPANTTDRDLVAALDHDPAGRLPAGVRWLGNDPASTSRRTVQGSRGRRPGPAGLPLHRWFRPDDRLPWRVGSCPPDPRPSPQVGECSHPDDRQAGLLRVGGRRYRVGTARGRIPGRSYASRSMAVGADSSGGPAGWSDGGPPHSQTNSSNSTSTI